MIKSSSQFPETLPALFYDRFKLGAGKEALWVKTSAGPQAVTWDQWRQAVEETAAGLYACGVEPGDRVAILSENRPEWTYADLGALFLGAVTVPIYPTSSPKETAYILENSESKVLFLSSREHGERLKADLPAGIRVFIFNPGEAQPGAEVFDDLRNQGRHILADTAGFIESRLTGLNPENAATIIYTSGTTGPPKGVMLTHKNFIANCRGASEVIQISENDLALSFLPLSHVFERLAGYYFFALNGGRIAYAESMKTVPEDMLLFRPTVAASVPRLYEKMHSAIMEKVAQSGPLRKRLFAWAIRVGARKREYDLAGKAPITWKLSFAAAQKLVLSKISAKLGGRIRFFISGGAPLSRQLGEFFYAAGVTILEGYGLTETSPVIAVNSPQALKFGTVGKPLANAEVRIAPDGEILTRGPCVMKGYYKNEAATREVLQDGWFHTGDIGEFDGEGFLKITDRKKDIIVTSGGKNISPQNIEGLILSDPLFTQAVVIGDRRNYLVALLALNRAAAESEAAKAGIQIPKEGFAASPEFYVMADERIRAKTRDLSRYEQIKYFGFLDRELSQEAGELTPTLKVKRKAVMEKYKDLIDSLYRKGEAHVSGGLS
ncbi:MAG: long-chain fatty acid--CoA ligase [Candidatus Omnitrophica bacterium]|nr:long-chain fatty acid--CoA ligase [Candidatus Omnitrophota bacterium]